MTEPNQAVAQAVEVRRVDRSMWQVHRAVRLAMLLDQPLAYGSSFEREIAFDDQVWLDRIAGAASWLAFEGTLPVGSVTMFHAPEQPEGEAYLVGMWVAAHARGRGVADALVAALVEHARATGVRRVVLDVAEENHRAAGFYRRAGFVPTGRTGELPGHPEVRELEMELVLD